MTCVVCRHKGNVTLVELPLVGRQVAVCARCRTGALIRHMRSLIAR
jgi:hypothetical protein